MSCSATAISSHSNLCSGLASGFPARTPVLIGAALATRAMSASPFQICDGACELPSLGFKTRNPFRVLTTLSLGKLANYPTVKTLHVVEADPLRQLHSYFVVHTRRRGRPRPSNPVLVLCGITRQLVLEPGCTTALVCLQHSYVYTSVLLVQLIRGDVCSHPLEGDRPDRKQLQQISAYRGFLPRPAGGQTVFSVASSFPAPHPGPLP